MSSSRVPVSGVFSMEVASFQYREMLPGEVTQGLPAAREEANPEAEARATEAMWAQRLQAARTAAAAEAATATEARLREEFEQRAKHEAARISAALTEFERERKEYFARVEGEIVRLSLSIAAKILHREAQVDPMLVAAIVQVALSQLKEGTSANLRVRPEEAQRWRSHLSGLSLNVTVAVVEDGELASGDCVLDTEMGSVNFSLEKQLKEVEQGFFDLLAQKPG